MFSDSIQVTYKFKILAQNFAKTSDQLQSMRTLTSLFYIHLKPDPVITSLYFFCQASVKAYILSLTSHQIKKITLRAIFFSQISDKTDLILERRLDRAVLSGRRLLKVESGSSGKAPRGRRRPSSG